MAKWMGHPRPSKKELPEWMKKYPSLIEYYVGDKSLRINLVLDKEISEKLLTFVSKEFGKINPTNIKKTALMALKKFLEEK